jgi:hypothetical protein
MTNEMRKKIAYDLLERDVWSKMPRDEYEREPFLWAEDRFNKSLKSYMEARKGFDLDECDEAYEQMLDDAGYFLGKFEDKGMTVMPKCTFVSLMIDLAA